MQTGPSRAGGAIPRLPFHAPRRHRPVSVVPLVAVLLLAAAAAGAAEQDRQDSRPAPPGPRIGRAAWDGAAFHRRPTPSGGRFDPPRMPCADRTLPPGTPGPVT